MTFALEPHFWSFWLSPAMLAILGACIGSFLNVVILRLPAIMEREWIRESTLQLSDAQALAAAGGFKPSEVSRLAESIESFGARVEATTAKANLSTQASRCPHCGHKLRWHENLPIVGWLRLRGKCASCKAPIDARYLIVEAATATAFAAVAVRFGPTPASLLWCGFTATLITLAMIDWDTTLLPDTITQPLLWAGLIAAMAGWTIPLQAAIAGAIAGYMSLWVVATLYERVRGQMGMAPGDFKLLAAIGAWLGWQSLLPVALIAAVLGVTAGGIMKANATLRDGLYFPFGPFLAAAAMFVMYAGPARVLGWLS